MNNIYNIVFYKKIVNGIEMKAALIYGKDGSIRAVSYKEGIQVCTDLANKLNITSKDAFKEMINKNLVHVVKYSELKNNRDKYRPEEFKKEKANKVVVKPITEEEKRKNPDLKDTDVLDGVVITEALTASNKPIKVEKSDKVRKTTLLEEKLNKIKEKFKKPIRQRLVAGLLVVGLVASGATYALAKSNTKAGKIISSGLDKLRKTNGITLDVSASETEEATAENEVLKLLEKTTNKYQKKFMKNVYDELNNYNGTFADAYVEKDKDIRAALSFDEMVSLKVAYNDYNKDQLQGIFNGASIRSSQMDRDYKNATLQLMGAHVLEDSEKPVDMSGLLDTKEGKDYYNEMHALFLKIKDADTLEEKEAAAKVFGKFVRDNYPMSDEEIVEGISHADAYKDIKSYKSSGVPMIAAFEILCQNYGIDSTLTDKEIDFINNLGLCNLADENFELVEMVTYTSTTDKENPTYDQYKAAINKELDAKGINVIDDAHRDLSKLDRFNDEVNWHFEDGEWVYVGGTYTTTSTREVVSTRTSSKTTYKKVVEKVRKKITPEAKKKIDDEIEKENEKAKKEAEKKAEKKREEMQKDEDNKAEDVKKEIEKEKEEIQKDIDDANKQIEKNHDDDPTNDKPVNEDDIGHGTDFDDNHSDKDGNLDNSVEDITTDPTGDKTNEPLPDPNETGKKFDAAAPKAEPAPAPKSNEQAVNDYVEKQASQPEPEEDKEKTLVLE